MRLALFLLCPLLAFGQHTVLQLPSYDQFRYVTAGAPFRYTFQPAGGTAPYRFALETGATLPTGLQLNATSGELTGAVTPAGEYRTSVCIVDAARAMICVPFLVIVVAKDGETYTELQPARANTDYQNLISRPGEFTQVEYTPVSGRLPQGMVLEITGRLYGRPEPPGGAFAFRARGRNQDDELVTKGFLIRVLGPLAATVTLPNAFSATPYSVRMSVIGDMPPHTWSVRRGPLPPGFILTDDGMLSGLLNSPNSYLFTLRVTDASLSYHDREMTLQSEGNLPPLLISNASLPGAALGVAYRQQLNVSGGREPYSYRILGALPPGLILSPTALISGTPTTIGSYTFTVQMNDVSGATVLKTLTIVVGNLRYSGPATVSLFAAEPASVVLTAEGGTAPYKWSLVSGTLPGGISLSDTGVLSGTTLSVGSVLATLRLQDGGGRTVEFPITVNVAGARPLLSRDGIVNGASFGLAGQVAPGEIVTLFGQRMGPPQVAPFMLDGNSRVPVALAGTQVLLGGLPAPLLYVSAGQIGAIVPYGLGGRSTVDVVVSANGVRSEAVEVRLTASAPGIFTATANGQGQAAALNQDGTVNGPANRAAAGSVVVLFATGEGQTLPTSVDGSLHGPVTARPSLPLRVTIGGKEAEILYAGGAPGLVSGLLQVNARVPVETNAGTAVPVVLRVGETESGPGVTLAVQ